MIATMAIGAMIAANTLLGVSGYKKIIKSKNDLNEYSEQHRYKLKEFMDLYALVESHMNNLTMLKTEVVDHLDNFSETFAKLSNRPVFEEREFEKLPVFDNLNVIFSKLTNISDSSNFITSMVEGMSITAGIVATGVIVNIVGSKTLKRSRELQYLASQKETEIRQLQFYLSQIYVNIEKLGSTIENVLDEFREEYITFERIVVHNNDWNTYTNADKVVVERLVKLVAILHKLINMRICKIIRNLRGEVIEFDINDIVYEE